ncbi:extracellular solute-binding protein [Haploplasma axanthum]|uniref:Spermidine/putrescine-binding periplasmic protein n=1 Tax=Haploplasma axanthum TaxID=29552 RepID=A0A449BDX8_HAPAX|nr:extracellular solute-binding protein [Haploplasma axanthum]VEU80649.1 Spermidine/putrescine-binding periplasmic protein precursor [Haploplasma axanthum]
MLKNKKLIIFPLFMFILLILSSCTSKNKKLLILNWGEYINDELVAKFEEENDVEVVISIAESNELFYSKIKSGTTVYDLVVPSDYMIEKMMEKELLQEIDFTKLTNYDQEENPYMPGVLNIQKQMVKDNEKYAVPYFWGTFGLMYNKQKQGLEQSIIENGWNAYFNDSLLPANTRKGMYNVSRYAYAAAMYYNQTSANEFSDALSKKAEADLKAANINEWGTDSLKKGIVANNLDLAFVYTGDFLDMLYVQLDDGKKLEEMTFDIHIPENTIAFMDAFVIPKKARNVDLAHKFIDFFLDSNNALANASVVGYATPLVNSYNEIVNPKDNDDWSLSWAYANNKYYPKDEIKGIPLKNFQQDILDKINQMVNRVKIS